VSDSQIPDDLLEALRRLARQKRIDPESFELVFVGNVGSGCVRTCREKGLEAFVHFIPYVPHREIFEYMRSASLLLLLIPNRTRNKDILPGKLFEYLRSGKPVLAIGPQDGESGEILTQTGRGRAIDYGRFDEINRYIETFIEDFQAGKRPEPVSIEEIRMFDRKVLTKQLASLFQSSISSHQRG
jgi:glycosyltransferase involved in cell wall biosynthesis